MNNLLNIKSFLKFLGKNKAYTVIDVCHSDLYLYGTGVVGR